MNDPSILTAEVGAALGILGLLLVFLPLLLGAVADASGGQASQRERNWRLRERWVVPVLMAVAATDATLGLVTLWDWADVATLTGWVLLALIWGVVALSVRAIFLVRRAS